MANLMEAIVEMDKDERLNIRKKISAFFVYWCILAHFSASICQASSLMDDSAMCN